MDILTDILGSLFAVVVPAGGINVLNKTGTNFLCALQVLDADGNSFTVTNAVLDADGNSFTVI